MGGSGDIEEGSEIAVDSNGSIYVAGTYWRAAEIGGVTLEPASHRTTYLAQIDETVDGPAVTWVKNIGGTDQGQALPKELIVDESTSSTVPSLYLTGQFLGTIDFDPDPDQQHLVATTTPYDGALYESGEQGFLLRVSGNGDYGNVWQFGRRGNGVALQDDGSVCVVGRFDDESSAMLTQNLHAAGEEDGFLLRIDPDAPQCI